MLLPDAVFFNESDCVILNEIMVGKIKDLKTLISPENNYQVWAVDNFRQDKDCFTHFC